MDITALFNNVWSVILVVLFFGGSIFVHELGHFLAARRRGVKVERFSIGFGPKIFSWVGKDGVEYRLSWLPLGGYVALPQLADMSAIEGPASADTVKLPPPSYSTKVIVFAAGAFFNILFALALACIIWVTGYPISKSDLTTQVGYVAKTLNVDGKDVPSPAALAGIQTGDRILQIDGRRTQRWRDIPEAIVLGSGRDASGNPEVTLTLERDGQPLTVIAHPLLIGDVDKLRVLGIDSADDLTIGELRPSTPAATSGLQPGDVVVRFNDTPVFSTGHVQELVQANRDQPVSLTVKRGANFTTIQITPREETVPVGRGKNAQEKKLWLMGVAWVDQRVIIQEPPFRVIAEHCVKMWRTVGALINRDSDIGISKMSGPVGISRGFHQMAQIDWRLLLWFTIFVNVNLALMNLLPLPILDGGHILFATLARLRGRALSPEFMGKMTTAFLLILITMVIYITTYDFRRWISDHRDAPLSANPSPAQSAEPPSADPAPAKP
jgi:regulator of sigma E protease